MELHPKTSAALSVWLGQDTWHTDHSNDMNRFYDFVNTLWQEHGAKVDLTQLQDEIERQAVTEGNEALSQVVRERVSLAGSILDFLKRTRL